MRKNKFKSFASRLNKDGDHPEKISFESPEEQAEYDKLDFLWNRCLPEETGEPDIWAKVQAKINGVWKTYVCSPENEIEIAVQPGSHNIEFFLNAIYVSVAMMTSRWWRVLPVT
jgi:hypothetical protein